MDKTKMLDLDLALFDGGAAGGEGGGATAPGEGETSQKGGSQAIPGHTRRGKSGESQGVVFGKQEPAAVAGAAAEGQEPQAPPSDAGKGKEGEVQVTSDTLEDKKKAFFELVNGEYKDLYTQEVQRLVDRRFRETRGLEEALTRQQPVLDMLMQRYGIGDGDVSKLVSAMEEDEGYWAQAAEEAGMSVEQYKQFQKLQRENAALLKEKQKQQSQQAAQAQIQKWTREGQELAGVYPDFDFANEAQNPLFLSMLRSGVPVRHAYEVIHMDDIKAGVAQESAKRVEKQVVDGIRTKGARPAENGMSSQSAFTVKDDVHKLTKAERAEIARRAARGETIRF